MASEFTYADDAIAIARVTDLLRGTARVAIDTEADSLHHYFEKVCLIQLSFGGAQYIIDPLRGASLTELLAALSQKALIFQGADYDLRMLYKSFGFRPQVPVFDTKLAAQVLGYEQVGLAALVERVVGGVAISKTEQKADWSQRPLPAKQLAYASDDTKYLEHIADVQTAELEALNRMAWHRECCQRVVQASGLSEHREEQEAWRVKGSAKLPPKELVFVRALWQWRDAEARETDRPPFYIMKNEEMIALAGWRALHPQASLRQGPPWLQRVTGARRARLDRAIRSADHTPEAAWPLPLPRRAWATERPDQAKLDRLLAACKTLAEELRIEPSFLASRGALTAVIQHQPQSVEAVMDVSGLMHWQAALMMPAIQTLASRTRARV